MSNKMGRPRKYTPEELTNKFNEYIQYCVENARLANIDGFCIYADIDEQTFYNYKNNSDYLDSIKRVEHMLLDETLRRGLEQKNPAFIIFYLKNKFGWADKQEIVQTTDNNVRLDGITADDLKSLVDVLKDE